MNSRMTCRCLKREEDDQGESDVQSLLQSSTGLVAFRVLHGHPEHLKYVPMPLASSPLFVKQALVVTVHPVLEINTAHHTPWIQLFCPCSPNDIGRPHHIHTAVSL